jgi:hypothetical protein
MKDRSKKLLVINTGKKGDQEGVYSASAKPSVAGGTGMALPGNLSDYLLKSIWDRVWEIKTDSQGNEYIFGKLPVVTQYGITMYADGGELNLPSIYAGIPFDNKTIWLNPETRKVEVIGGTGGGVADSVHWNNIEGKPTFASVATSGKYADLSGLPDLSVYATTEYLTAELKKYVTLNTEQTIGSHKDFLNGLSVGGLGITKSQDDVIYLDANLVVRGGITMFGTNSVDVPTIMDAIATDGVNLKVVDGVLTFVGSSGGVDESVLADYAKKTDLSRYLPLSGGELSNTGFVLTINRLENEPAWIQFKSNWEFQGSIGAYNNSLLWLDKYSNSHTILHSGNWSQFVTAGDGGNYLPLSGGILNGALSLFRPNIANTNSYTWWIDNSGFYLSLSSGKIPLLITNDAVNIGYNSSYLTNLVVNGVVRGTNVSSKGASWGQYLNSEEALYGCTNITSSGIQPILGWSSSVGGFSSKFVIGSYTDGASYGGMYLTVINSSNPSTGRRLILQPEGNMVWEGHILTEYIVTGQGGYYFNDFQFARFNDYGNLVVKSNYAKMFFRPNDESESGQMTIDTSGDVLVSGGITMYSDQRKKTILNNVELTLQQIADAPLIEHYYNSDAKKTTHVGSIAQYWADMNDWFCKLDGEGYYTMEIQNAALASAISIARELVKYESKTDRKIRLLKQRVKELEDKIEKLKNN